MIFLKWNQREGRICCLVMIDMVWKIVISWGGRQTKIGMCGLFEKHFDQIYLQMRELNEWLRELIESLVELKWDYGRFEFSVIFFLKIGKCVIRFFVLLFLFWLVCFELKNKLRFLKPGHLLVLFYSNLKLTFIVLFIEHLPLQFMISVFFLTNLIHSFSISFI